ncbi:MAG: LPXTG cell wall anchor domain-containing protein, partial [Atopobium sp.]|nr:LPXTG cell wall anchor domain-containing protein [Atopobium sp.]
AITATSDSSGKITFTNIPYGDYVLKETKAASNHEVCADIAFSLRDGNEAVADNALDLGKVNDDLKTGTISLTKTDGATPLAGAEFTLSREDGGFSTTATSDAQGNVSFTNVPYSDSAYTIHESKTPDDSIYFKMADITDIYLNDQNSDVTTDGQAYSLALGNQVDVPYGSITLSKTDEKGSPLADAEFQVLDVDGNVVQTNTTDAEGTITFANLPLEPTGETTYTLHESNAPADYGAAADQVVVLSNTVGGRNATASFSDDLKTGTISLTKVDSAAGDPLEGAEFTLYDSTGTNKVVGEDGNAITATSDSSGKITFTNIPYGDYVLKETTTPDGYLATKAIKVSLHEDNAAVVDGALDLGKVGDAPNTPLGVIAAALPQTGDIGYSSIGWLVLAAALAFGAAGLVRHKQSKK